MKRKNIVILGAGNTADELIPILDNLQKNKKFKINAIIDDDKKFYNKSVKGIPIEIGLENAIKRKTLFSYLELVPITIKIIEKKYWIKHH